jgi:hypothetical protein
MVEIINQFFAFFALSVYFLSLLVANIFPNHTLLADAFIGTLARLRFFISRIFLSRLLEQSLWYGLFFQLRFGFRNILV